MPEQKNGARKSLRSKPHRPIATIEVDGYLSGMYRELHDLVQKYAGLTAHLAEVEARVDLTEHHLRATRDHLQIALREAAEVTIPPNWDKTLRTVQFVGMRLADACVSLLKERKNLTPDELLRELNHGMFRFRTSTPLREIHAALMRHPSIERADGAWVWTGDQPNLPMPLKVVQKVPEDEAVSA
jgi:hypothetical protein